MNGLKKISEAVKRHAVKFRQTYCKLMIISSANSKKLGCPAI